MNDKTTIKRQGLDWWLKVPTGYFEPEAEGWKEDERGGYFLPESAWRLEPVHFGDTDNDGWMICHGDRPLFTGLINTAFEYELLARMIGLSSDN